MSNVFRTSLPACMSLMLSRSTQLHLLFALYSHVPNVYMKLNDPFPSARAFKTLLCSTSNKERLQKLICRHLTDVAQSVDTEIVYSVGSKCTNLSTQEFMPDYSFSQSEADTILFSAYAVLRDSGYSGPVVIDSADTDTYVAAAAISQKLPSSKERRKQSYVAILFMNKWQTALYHHWM